MNFNLIHPETWIRLNQKVHDLWSLPEDVTVRVFQGVPHAAYELALGTALFLSHKRSVGFFQGQTPAFQAVLPFLYKEAFQIQVLSQSQLLLGPPASPEPSVQEWLKLLKGDTSFVMSSEDNPLTGERFAFADVDQVLHDKKIFSIRVSHRAHLFQREFSERHLTPSSLQICEISPRLAVAICGGRFKSPVQISSHLAWDEAEVLKELEALRPEGQEQKIRAFEASLPQGFLALPMSESRIFDRSLIYHPQVQGEALASELKRRLSLSTQAVSSLSPCQWGFLDLSWWQTKPSDEILRSLVVLDASILQNPKLTQALLESAQACQI